MLNILGTWFFSALLLFITSRLVDGFALPNFKTALQASLLIGLLNIIIRPVLSLLSVPFNVTTLGLFTFVVNAGILKLADSMMDSFFIRGWVPAILAAVFLAIIQVIANVLIPGKRRFLGR